MVGYDKPHVTNDMITRFMDVDFDLLPGILAASNSKVGSNSRLAIGAMGTAAAGLPLLKGGDTDWECEWAHVPRFLHLHKTALRGCQTVDDDTAIPPGVLPQSAQLKRRLTHDL